MVLLTMTASIVEALEFLQSRSPPNNNHPENGASKNVHHEKETAPEPSLADPAIDNPISHGQIIAIHKQLKTQAYPAYHLDTLLRASKIYTPPPPPKPDPVRSKPTNPSFSLSFKPKKTNLT